MDYKGIDESIFQTLDFKSINKNMELISWSGNYCFNEWDKEEIITKILIQFVNSTDNPKYYRTFFRLDGLNVRLKKKAEQLLRIIKDDVNKFLFENLRVLKPLQGIIHVYVFDLSFDKQYHNKVRDFLAGEQTTERSVKDFLTQIGVNKFAMHSGSSNSIKKHFYQPVIASAAIPELNYGIIIYKGRNKDMAYVFSKVYTDYQRASAVDCIEAIKLINQISKYNPLIYEDKKELQRVKEMAMAKML